MWGRCVPPNRTRNVRILAIQVPLLRIVVDVLPHGVQFAFVPDYVLEVIPLPNRCARSALHPVDAPRREGLEGTYNLRQSVSFGADLCRGRFERDIKCLGLTASASDYFALSSSIFSSRFARARTEAPSPGCGSTRWWP